MKKLIWRIITVSLFIILIVVGTVTADEKKNLEVKVQAGFEGEYKYGYTVPINLEVTNDKKDVNGEIQIEAETQTKNVTIYSKPISILKGEKKTYTLNIPMDSYIKASVIIIDGKHKAYEKKQLISYGANKESYLVGILSDDFDSVNFFSYSNRVSNSAKLNEKNFPRNTDVIDMFDAILINNFDTSKLSSEQYSTIKKWVNRGGILIIGTGPTHSKTLSIFKDDFISIKVQDMKDITTNALYDYIGSKAPGPMVINTVTMDIGSGQAYLEDENNTLISHIKKGAGSIYITHFDLGLKPITDWDDNKKFGEHLAANTSRYIYNPQYNQQIGFSSYLQSYGNIQEALMTIPDIPNPSPWNFIIIALIYTLIVGPVSYIILKKKDKREYMWLTIPALSVLFCVAIYFLGFGTRLNKPIANVISVVDVTGEEKTGLVSFAGIFTPVKKNVKVTTGEGMNISSILQANNYYYGQPQNNNIRVVDSKINYSSKTSVEFLKNKVWSMRTLVLEHNSIGIGEYVCQINYWDNKFRGTLKNNTGMDLETCVIITPNKYIDLGPIKNGEIKDIDTSGSTYTNKSDILRFTNTGINGWNNKKLTDKKLIEMRRNQQNVSIFNYYIMSGFEDSYQVKVLGIGTTPIAKDILVDNKIVKKYEKTLLVSDCKVSFKNGNKIEYPSRYFKPVILNSTFRGYDPYGESYNGKGNIELIYELADDINVNEVSFDSHIRNVRSFSSTDVKGYLWNYKTKTWDEGDYNSYTMRNEDISKYIGEYNTIKYKIESNDEVLNLKLPYISMKGSVK